MVVFEIYTWSYGKKWRNLGGNKLWKGEPHGYSLKITQDYSDVWEFLLKGT